MGLRSPAQPHAACRTAGRTSTCFGVTEDALPDVLADWSSWLYPHLGAVHHFDLRAGSVTYRAFLLADGLEIDVGFAPVSDFGPLGDGAFEVVFGDPVKRNDSEPDTST